MGQKFFAVKLRQTGPFQRRGKLFVGLALHQSELDRFNRVLAGEQTARHREKRQRLFKLIITGQNAAVATERRDQKSEKARRLNHFLRRQFGANRREVGAARHAHHPLKREGARRRNLPETKKRRRQGGQSYPLLDGRLTPLNFYHNGKLLGASARLDSTFCKVGVVATRPGRWNIVASSSLFKINGWAWKFL